MKECSFRLPRSYRDRTRLENQALAGEEQFLALAYYQQIDANVSFISFLNRLCRIKKQR